MFELDEVRFRRGCQAIDPRDGSERERLKAGPDLKIVLDGHVVSLISGAETVLVPFSSVSGARLKRLSSTTVAVPAAKSCESKGGV